VTIYYGIPILRLAIWTAQNDFREACKSELEAGLQLSAACNKTLAQPAQPPPIMKRTISDMEDKDLSKELAPWMAATCFAFLLALCSGLKGSTITQPNLPERSVFTTNTSQATSALESLTLEELMEAVIEQRESHPQSIISFLEIYLARETFGPEPDTARVVRAHVEALIFFVASRCPSIKVSGQAIKYRKRKGGESEPQESETPKVKPIETILRESPPTQNGMETEADEEPAKDITAPAPALVAPSPMTTTTADSNTITNVASSSAKADCSTKRWNMIPEVMNKAIARSFSFATPQPKFLTRVDVKKPRGPSYARMLLRGLLSAFGVVSNAGAPILNQFGRMSRDLFETFQSLFYLLALTLAAYWTSLLVFTLHGRATLSVQLATMVVCFFAKRSLDGRQVDRRWDRALDVYVDRFLLFSVYTGLRRIWPSDTLTHNALAWATGTGLCTWMFAVYCVVHETEHMRRTDGSTKFLKR
jgi:hypothetical protein